MIQQMIPLISTCLMFLFFLTGALIHLINRQSKSYMLIAGYLSATFLIAFNVARSKDFLDFGIWIFPFGLICLGELFRFHNIEKAFSEELQKLSNRQDINIPFLSFRDLPTNKKVTFFSNTSIILQYHKENSLIALLYLAPDKPLTFTPEDFDIHIKSFQGKTTVQYKGLTYVVTSSGQEFKSGTNLTIISTEESCLEIILTKR